MFKVRRGDAPAGGEKVSFAGAGDPLHASVRQGGFEGTGGGDLRDHNGCHANAAAIMGTTHYDNTYGTKAPSPGSKVSGSSGGSPSPKTTGPKRAYQ